MPLRRRPVSLALAAIAIAAAMPAYAAPNKRFDGRWSVEIITREGRCDSYKWTIDVNAGHVADVEGYTVQAVGGVDAKGRVGLTVMNGTERVMARGDMRKDSGYGTWQAPSRQCAGDWRATALQ